ncbi:sensor domain-containing protein [Desulfopila aestuarii]|uniref:PAS domain S-box-containing protein/diguanylate cyclase (GGDEF) domain-containing protein n=1 Tax=Desulfopila aestuarii DSM 18488 TaxID=1121416 RepID=A0A1M7YK82_9BACT|nr:bifunctional diguanylate cyclase/phosphodiesterase [Desulfopila aestuarii]SHO53023.1 PAS domain S-box-containing protein/diguanylate cyclase (GGDEF) domain-containing protein [Desulfopila aestuarii DSM 18488]
MPNTDSNALYSRETAYKYLFEKTPNAVVFRDAGGMILSVNEAFEQIFGFSRNDVVGRRLDSLLRPGGGEHDEPTEWVSSIKIDNIRTKRSRSDGRLIDVAVSVFPIVEDQAILGTFVIYHNDKDLEVTTTRLFLAEKKYLSIFNNAVEGIFLTTPLGTYLDVNPALAAIYGFSSPDELIHHFRDIKQQLYVDPGRRDEFISTLRQNKKVTGFESQVRTKSGEVIWITENARAVFADTGEISYYEGTVMDITARKQAELNLEIQTAYFSQLFANSPQAIVIIDMHRNVVSCNAAFEGLFGFHADDIIGFGMRTFIVPDELLVECEKVRASILAGKTVQCETSRRHRDGRLIPVSMIGFPIRVGDKINGIIYVYQDISERKAFEEQITHQAFHDALTGLPNRMLLAERLERALERSRRRPAFHYALLLLDLNKFKTVNDSLGHPAGDQLLIQVGRRLSSCTRAMDTVARLGGDEFAIILEEFSSEEELLVTVRRMHSFLCNPFTIDKSEISTGASIGIVPSIADYSSAEDILRDADIAMYRAKQQGKGIMLFDAHMHQELVESLSLEMDLREVLERDGLLLFYQPIVSVAEERLEGFEALVRWNHPLRGMIPPDRFIPLAEETGLIIDLGKWVISEACRSLKLWQEIYPKAAQLTMNVNVSIRQFATPGLVEHISEVLQLNKLAPACLKIEVTESVIMQDKAHVVGELNRLRALGVQIAIDDFGTGYSSLSYLQNMPIDHLKIDRSFISGFQESQENDQIVRSIISLARSLGLSVIAEGVETRGQLEKLRALQCDKAQGFMFSRPVDEKKAREIIGTSQLSI